MEYIYHQLIWRIGLVDILKSNRNREYFHQLCKAIEDRVILISLFYKIEAEQSKEKHYRISFNHVIVHF